MKDQDRWGFPVRENSYAQYHVVERGETLEHIAEYYYGTPAFTGKLLEANRDLITAAGGIKAGQRLLIP